MVIFHTFSANSVQLRALAHARRSSPGRGRRYDAVGPGFPEGSAPMPPSPLAAEGGLPGQPWEISKSKHLPAGKVCEAPSAVEAVSKRVFRERGLSVGEPPRS